VSQPRAIPPTPQLTTPDQTAMIGTAMTYWGAFAHDGDPSTGHALPWPRYADGRSVMSLQAAYDSEVLHSANLRQTHHCSLWDTIAP
jgi:carboxylesterase type B